MEMPQDNVLRPDTGVEKNQIALQWVGLKHKRYNMDRSYRLLAEVKMR